MGEDLCASPQPLLFNSNFATADYWNFGPSWKVGNHRASWPRTPWTLPEFLSQNYWLIKDQWYVLQGFIGWWHMPGSFSLRVYLLLYSGLYVNITHDGPFWLPFQCPYNQMGGAYFCPSFAVGAGYGLSIASAQLHYFPCAVSRTAGLTTINPAKYEILNTSEESISMRIASKVDRTNVMVKTESAFTPPPPPDDYWQGLVEAE
jgi:hypothetical protein